MALSADDVLEEVGSFGWFQIRLLILFNLLSALLFGWAVMVTGIITAEPPLEVAFTLEMSTTTIDVTSHGVNGNSRMT